MNPDITLRILAGVALLAANGFFVATEFALTRLRQIPREEMGDSSGLRTAWEMTERLEIHLTGCQLGISISSILLGVVAEPAVTALLEPLAEVVGVAPGMVPTISVVAAVLCINLVHQIWGEQTPTYLGVERPVQVARRLAPILAVWTRALSPLIRLGDWAAKATLRTFGVTMTRSWTEGEDDEGRIPGHAELLQQMGELLSRGHLAEDRRREVLRALAIERIPVRRIMVPREEITALSLGRSLEENLSRIAHSRYVRFPLLDADESAYVGTIYVSTLVGRSRELEAGDVTLEELAAPGLRVPADLPVSALIDRFQDESQEVALVEDGGDVVGLVTVTDAFEAIAGEVEDPFD